MDYQLGPGPLQVDQNTIDEKIKGDIGIVENGDIATHPIPRGYYVIWKGDLYIAKTDISSGTTLSAASNGNLTAKPNGLGGEVASLSDQMANLFAIINGISVSPNSSTEVDYPTGYTRSNTFVMAIRIASYYTDYRNVNVELTASKIKIYNNTSQTWGAVSIILFKTA